MRDAVEKSPAGELDPHMLCGVAKKFLKIQLLGPHIRVTIACSCLMKEPHLVSLPKP